jgi:Putative phage tail protein
MSGGSETIVNKSNSSHTVSESSPRVAGLTIQTSSYGLTIPIVYGRTRIAGNLLWVGNFLTQSYTETNVTNSTPEQVNTTDGGKFGKSTTTITPASESTETTITYVYYASPVFSLGEGPVVGVNAIWREKTKLPGNGWGEFFNKSGAVGQSALSFMGDQTIAYSGLALAYADNTEMTSSGGMPTFAFEVDGKHQYGSGVVDANPANILYDLCTNPAYGAGFDTDVFYDLTQYSNYCRALGLFISPVYDAQRPVAEILTELLVMTNSTVVPSQGQLKIVPYGDEVLTGNGATYTPNITPEYDLDDGDFLENGSAGPVKCTRRTPADSFNTVRVEYLDRGQDYAVAIAEAFDQAHIEANGVLAMENIKCNAITEPALARQVAQIILQRQLYVRNEYEFSLGWNYARLEPMDLVTLTDAGLGLDHTPVRIISIDESANSELSITAEDYPFGVASSTHYPDHPGLAIVVDYNASPGSVLAPRFLEPPIELAGRTLIDVWAAVTGNQANWGGCQVWFSLDGDEYRQIGTVRGGAKYGTLTASLPDVAGTAAVALVGKGGVINNVPAADAANLASLCWVEGVNGADGGEFFGFETATLTSANHYTLGGLIRGAYESNQRAKSTGAAFVRLDANIVASGPLQRAMIGQPTYWKFTSFNIYGGGQQTLTDVDPYTYTVSGNMALLPPPDVQGFGIDDVVLNWTAVDAGDLSGYVLRFHYGNNINWDTATPMNVGVITESPFALVNRPVGVVTIMIKAVDTFGNLSRLPASIITNLGVPRLNNVVDQFDFHPVFSGTRTGCAVVSGELLANAVDSYFGDDLQAHFGPDLVPHFKPSAYGAMQYVTDEVLVTKALTGSVMHLLMDTAGDDLVIEFRKTSPGAYFGNSFDPHFGADFAPHFAEPGPWQLWPGSMAAVNDGFQFRFTIGAGGDRGRFTTLSLIVDAPNIAETVSDLAIAVGGSVIPHTKPFTRIINVQATLQAGTTAARTVEVNKSNPLAPIARVYDIDHVAVGGATADFTLEGY